MAGWLGRCRSSSRQARGGPSDDGVLTLTSTNLVVGEPLTFHYETDTPDAPANLNWVGLYDNPADGPTDQTFHGRVDGLVLRLRDVRRGDPRQQRAERGHALGVLPLQRRLHLAGPTADLHAGRAAAADPRALRRRRLLGRLGADRGARAASHWPGCGSTRRPQPGRRRPTPRPAAPAGSRSRRPAWSPGRPRSSLPAHPALIEVTATDSEGRSAAVTVEFTVYRGSAPAGLKVASWNLWDAGTPCRRRPGEGAAGDPDQRSRRRRRAGDRRRSGQGAGRRARLVELPEQRGPGHRQPLPDQQRGRTDGGCTGGPGHRGGRQPPGPGLDGAPRRGELRPVRRVPRRRLRSGRARGGEGNDPIRPGESRCRGDGFGPRARERRLPSYCSAIWPRRRDLDWTKATAAQHCNAGSTAWPVTRVMTQAGLRDSYRVANPSPRSDPGNTWSPVLPVHPGGVDARAAGPDRLRRLRRQSLGVVESHALVTGFPAPEPDVGANSWTSDHKAAVTTFSFR